MRGYFFGKKLNKMNGHWQSGSIIKPTPQYETLYNYDYVYSNYSVPGKHISQGYTKIGTQGGLVDYEIYKVDSYAYEIPMDAVNKWSAFSNGKFVKKQFQGINPLPVPFRIYGYLVAGDGTTSNIITLDEALNEIQRITPTIKENSIATSIDNSNQQTSEYFSNYTLKNLIHRNEVSYSINGVDYKERTILTNYNFYCSIRPEYRDIGFSCSLPYQKNGKRYIKELSYSNDGSVIHTEIENGEMLKPLPVDVKLNPYVNKEKYVSPVNVYSLVKIDKFKSLNSYLFKGYISFYENIKPKA